MWPKYVILGLILLYGRALGWSFAPRQQPGAPQFSVVTAASQSVGKGQLMVLQGEAEKETFLDRVLGTNCYGKAVVELSDDCKHMDQEQKSRLALRLVNCQLATQGDTTFPCGPAQPLRHCTDALPDRAYQLYVEFLSHADNMCLFIQNQNFERYTEHMLNKLATGATYAKEQLALLGEQATEQHAQTTRQAQEFAAKAEESLQLGREAREVQQQLLVTTKGHREESLAYFTSLNARSHEVLQLQDQALTKATELQQGQAGMSQALSDGSARVENLFTFIDEHAQRQMELQQQHEEQQLRLTSELRSLATDTKGLRGAVDVVVYYQQRSDAALIKLLGRSYTLEDAAFYGAGLLAVAATGVVPGAARARLPVLAVLCSSLVGERLLLQRLHMVLERDPAEELVVYLPMHLVPLPGLLQHLAPEGPLAVNVKWALRRVLAATAALVVLYSMAAYRNYERDSYNAIRRIEAEAKASNSEQQALLARIEQRLAAIQAWDRERLLALSAAGSPGQLLPIPTHIQAAGTEPKPGTAARLLPPAPLAEEFWGPQGSWDSGGAAAGASPPRGHAQAGGLVRRRANMQPEQLASRETCLERTRSGGHATGPAARPAGKGVGQGASREGEPQLKTPVKQRQPAAPPAPGRTERKRRGSEDSHEVAATAGTSSGRRWGRHRLTSGTESVEEPPVKQQKQQAGWGKREGANIAAGQHGDTKRTRR